MLADWIKERHNIEGLFERESTNHEAIYLALVK
jgi:hypothetical protein